VPPAIMSALLITGFFWSITNVLTPQGKDMDLVLGPEVGHRSPINTCNTTRRRCPVFFTAKITDNRTTASLKST
jgi:hypothetical protein